MHFMQILPGPTLLTALPGTGVARAPIYVFVLLGAVLVGVGLLSQLKNKNSAKRKKDYDGVFSQKPDPVNNSSPISPPPSETEKSETEDC